MILKNIDGREADVAVLEGLLRETSNEKTKSRIQQEIWNIKSGIRGEGSAAHYLDHRFRDCDRNFVLHDLRISAGDGEFSQIDHLVINRNLGVAWLMETKNYSGRLSCNADGDWTVWYGSSKGIPVPSPIEQAVRQARTLKRWLDYRGFSLIREIIPIVLISPTSSINRKHLPSNAKVMKSDQFDAWRTKQLEADVGIVQAFSVIKRKLSGESDVHRLHDLCNKLIYDHVPGKFDWRAKFGMQEKTLDPNQMVAFQNPLIPDVITKPEISVVTPVSKIISAFSSERLDTHAGLVTAIFIEDQIAFEHSPEMPIRAWVEKNCRGRAAWSRKRKQWVANAKDYELIKRDLVTPPMDSKVVKSTDESAKSALEVGDEFGLIKTYFGDVNAIQIGEQVAFEHGPDLPIRNWVEKNCRGRARWSRGRRKWVADISVYPAIRKDLEADIER